MTNKTEQIREATGSPVGTALDLERFTEGDCHYLARAIHIRTSWPLMAFCYGQCPDIHAFVLMPDGRALDVEGPCDLETIRLRYGANRDAEFDWPTLREYFLPPTYGHGSYARARIVADRLLALPDVTALTQSALPTPSSSSGGGG